MEPEGLVSLLLVVSLLGLIGLGGFFYFFWKKSEERYQKLMSQVDSLDERSIHESSSFEKKSEQIRAAVIKQQEVFKEEHEIRAAAEGEILESLTNFQKQVENVVVADLKTQIEETRQANNRVEESMEHYGKKIESVRFRNELQSVYTLIRSNELGKAIETLKHLLDEDPADKEVRLLLSKSVAEINDLAGAKAILEQGLQNQSGDSDYLASLAHVHWLEGNYADMARVVTDGLVRDPNHTGLLFERSLLNSQQKKFDAAVADLESILERGVESSEIRYNLGLAYVSLGRISSAIQELRQSVSLDPFSAEANHALGLALLSGHRFKESRDFLERAREYDPQNVSIRLDLSTTYRVGGFSKHALDEASIAAELDPNSGRAILEKALAYHSLSQLREALEVLDTFLVKHPNFVRARSLKASILQDAERFGEAVTELRELVKKYPDDPLLYARLAEALKRSGDGRAALEVIESAAKRAPESAGIQLIWAKECLLNDQFEKIEGITTYIAPKIQDPKFQTQFIEIRMLHAIKTEKWSSLVKILDDLKKILEAHPDLIPIEDGSVIKDWEVLELSLDKNGQSIHRALVDLFTGGIDYQVLDETVTQVMKALLRPPKKPAPPSPPAETVPKSEQEPTVESVPEEGVPVNSKPTGQAPPPVPEVETVEPLLEDQASSPEDSEESKEPEPAPAEPVPVSVESEPEVKEKKAVESTDGEVASEPPPAPTKKPAPKKRRRKKTTKKTS